MKQIAAAKINSLHVYHSLIFINITLAWVNQGFIYQRAGWNLTCGKCECLRSRVEHVAETGICSRK